MFSKPAMYFPAEIYKDLLGKGTRKEKTRVC